TNGLNLGNWAPRLKAAGVTAINVSIDSLDPARFAEVTGRDILPKLLADLDRTLELGFERVKINAVLLKKQFESDLEGFLEFTRRKPVSVRLIELMQSGQNVELFKTEHVTGGQVQLALLSRGWRMQPRNPGDGPAIEFAHRDHLGKIGIIAPYSKDFCASCNRLRLSSRGGLRLCLYGEGDHSLRPLLQSDDQREALEQRIRILLKTEKAPAHLLADGKFGDTWNLSAIGG
ncbi:MAG: radical SAM protein, partial [Bdellovibrionota bacterium]